MVDHVMVTVHSDKTDNKMKGFLCNVFITINLSYNMFSYSMFIPFAENPRRKSRYASDLFHMYLYQNQRKDGRLSSEHFIGSFLNKCK